MQLCRTIFVNIHLPPSPPDFLGLTQIEGCIIYVEIKDGKIWIERDGTEIGVANELVEAGVPKQEIAF